MRFLGSGTERVSSRLEWKDRFSTCSSLLWVGDGVRPDLSGFGDPQKQWQLTKRDSGLLKGMEESNEVATRLSNRGDLIISNFSAARRQSNDCHWRSDRHGYR